MKSLLKTSFIVVLGFTAACSSMKKADKSFVNGEYQNAINLYKKSLKKDEAVANYRLAESYRMSNRIREAEPFYSASLEAGVQEENAKFYYGYSLKENGKYDQAEEVLQSYLDEATDEYLKTRAQREIVNLDELDVVKKKENYYRVKNLEAINTASAEYSPVFNRGRLYFTSNRDGGKIYQGSGTAFTDIYRVTSKGAIVDLNTLEALDPIINDPAINEGSITFSPDGTSMIYAKGNSGKPNGTNEVNLYFTRYRNGKWSKPRMLNINDTDSWDSSPSFSSDGRTLYFSSNREGGYGGLDLYSAKMNRRGRWGSVKNMGEVINTEGNEIFPYASSDGKLYFSSDGHPGMGGLDLFAATREQGQIEVQNLGPPMNSEADDFSIFLYNPSRGWFTSNRKDGKGDDDIWTFVNNDPDLKIVNYFLQGVTVSVDDDGNEEILNNTRVQIFSEDGELLDETITGNDGRFQFRVYPEEEYNLLGEKIEYFTTREMFSTLDKSVDKTSLTELVTNVTFDTKIALNKININVAIELEDIYYDFNQWDIREDAARELDKLVAVLQDNPEIEIELSSHTDNRASNAYNLDLSQKRAQSAVDYMASRGIAKYRMVPKGYGEEQPIIADAQTEEEHQQNRRTEFKVTKYNPATLKIDQDEEEEESGDFDLQSDEEDRYFKKGTGN